MEALSVELGKKLLRSAGSVNGISENGMPGMGKVHTDLVCASGIKIKAKMRNGRFLKGSYDPVMRHRVSSVRYDRHFFPVSGMTPDRIRESPALLTKPAVCQTLV